MKYRRILIKLSGEALSGDEKSGIFSSQALLETAQAIKEISNLGVEIAIVIGAGNICRGALVSSLNIERITGDKMGMLGTIINSFAMRDTLKSLGCNAEILSAVKMDDFAEFYSPNRGDELLKEKTIVVLGGGTGKPFFTTDTCAAKRAIELDCDAIFMAKNGVDGVYDDDPRVNKNAKMLKSIQCSQIISNNLKVMDIDAVKLLIDKDIDVRVFAMSNPENFIKIINGEDIGTTIMKG